MRGHRDLRLVIRLAIACAVVSLLAPWEALRLIAAAPLCLILTGYAVTSAAFGPRQLDRGRFVVLVLGMSLVTLVLCALLLNYVPGGIRDVSWAIVLVLVVIATSRLAAIERKKANGRPFLAGKPLRASRADLALLGGAAVAVVAALIVSATVYPADSAVGYTRLWMLPDESGAAVRVGVASNEQRATRYRFKLRVAGRDLLKRRLSLEPGEERELLISIPATDGGEPRRVAASLYRNAGDALYRRVTTWIGSDSPRP